MRRAGGLLRGPGGRLEDRLADFKRYVAKHRSAIGRQIVGWVSIERPTENQLVAMARPYFLRYDRMAGMSTLG